MGPQYRRANLGNVRERVPFSSSALVLGTFEEDHLVGAAPELVEGECRPTWTELVRPITGVAPAATPVGNNVTKYLGAPGTPLSDTPIPLYRVRFANEAVRNLGITLDTPPAAAETVTVTVVRSSDGGATWGDTPLTCTINGPKRAADDLVHWIVLAAGDPRNRRGLWSRFSFMPLPYMLSELGQFWVMQTLTCKTYPGCHYFQTACEALDAIMARRGRPSLEKVKSVEIATTKLGIGVTTFAAEYAAAHDTIRPVNINFDLRSTAAVMLHAGRLTSAELDPEWLARESASLRAWRERIRIRHDPALTAKLISSARSVSTGRRALRELRLRDLPRLLRRYSEEYGAKPPGAKEIGRLALSFVRRRRSSEEPRAARTGQRTTLYFPNRVEVRFADGSVETEQIHLPAGSFCAPHVERALETKFVHETAPSIGATAAHALFAAGLRLEEHPLSQIMDQALIGERHDRAVADQATP